MWESKYYIEARRNLVLRVHLKMIPMNWEWYKLLLSDFLQWCPDTRRKTRRKQMVGCNRVGCVLGSTTKIQRGRDSRVLARMGLRSRDFRAWQGERVRAGMVQQEVCQVGKLEPKSRMTELEMFSVTASRMTGGMSGWGGGGRSHHQWNFHF